MICLGLGETRKAKLIDTDIIVSTMGRYKALRIQFVQQRKLKQLGFQQSQNFIPNLKRTLYMYSRQDRLMLKVWVTSLDLFRFYISSLDSV